MVGSSNEFDCDLNKHNYNELVGAQLNIPVTENNMSPNTCS